MSNRETEILLHLSAPLERAIASLVLTSFNESFDVGLGDAAHVRLESTHDAIVYLIRRGIKDTVVNIDNRLDQAKGKLSSLQEIRTFFDAHPSESRVRAIDFPAGGAIAELIRQRHGLGANDASLSEMNAADADIEYTATQSLVARLNTVRDTLQLAEMPRTASPSD